MTKIVFYVFSGTGNTVKVAEECAARCRNLCAETTVFRLKKGDDAPDISAFDTAVVAFPVHGFNAPMPILDFVESLPELNGKKVYFLMTSGEPLKLNNAAAARPWAAVAKKGGEPSGAFRVVMPYNIIFRHNDKMASLMWQTAVERIAPVANMIVNGEKSELSVGLGKRFLSRIVSIEHPAMPVIGRGFGVSKNCVGCGKCAAFCPQLNIRMKDGKPKFGKECVGCMACSFNCPVDAVRTGILNGWRVNGAYDFSAPPATEKEFCKFLKKTYIRYFQKDETVLK